MRQSITRLVESKAFTRFILVVIIANAIVLGLETWPRAAELSGGLLSVLNMAFIAIYVIEAVLKLIAYRLTYFRSGWNVFDFIIVVVCLIPTGGIFSGLRILRVFRVLRAFRLVSSLAPLRRIVSAVVRSLPGVGWTLLLMLLVYYVYSIVGIHLFRAEYPQRFESLGAAVTTLFELTTLEGWQDIVRPITDTHGWAWIYFLSFMVIASFILLNVVLGIVIDSLELAREDEHTQARQDMVEDGVTEDEAIYLAMDDLRQRLDELDHLLKRRQTQITE